MQSDIFRSCRHLLRSFVQLAIKNQALREQFCQRHVFFEAHRILNTKKFRDGFFFCPFSPDVEGSKIFSAPFCLAVAGEAIPVGRGEGSGPVLLHTVKIPHLPSPLGPLSTQTHLLLTCD